MAERHFSGSAGTRRLCLQKRNHNDDILPSRFRICRRSCPMPAETEKCRSVIGARPCREGRRSEPASPFAAGCAHCGPRSGGGVRTRLSVVAGCAHCGPCFDGGMYTDRRWQYAQPRQNDPSSAHGPTASIPAVRTALPERPSQCAKSGHRFRVPHYLASPERLARAPRTHTRAKEPLMRNREQPLAPLTLPNS